ncbi:MAG: two-component regulator propeller domain-containing protein [Cyclobacteriaceae bacterium]
MIPNKRKIRLHQRFLIVTVATLLITSCTGQVKDKLANDTPKNELEINASLVNQSTTFPQIHTNLNGMVREFVRTMYQDKKGNYWFGTNGNGIIRYDGKTLETITHEGKRLNNVVREIVEDKAGNIWFGTDNGLIKYDGDTFVTFAEKEGLQNKEIWGLTIDNSGLLWVGSVGGVSHFDGKKFTPFLLPETKVENPKHMLSDKLIFKFMQDKNGSMWFVTDGNGIFTYKNGEFIHVTTKNGLTDNNVADVLQDRQGNIWIGTFNGGVSKFDGKTYTNFTKDGVIKGLETYNFVEDSQGHIWFSAEGHGVYRYDGLTFTQYSIFNGLTSNVVQSIYQDNKGQIWCGTWQGICVYDGQKFVDAKDKEPWTK